MIRISHKSVYSLIEEHYVRKTLKGVITDIDLSTFRMAQVFALTNEDFEFMNVMQEDLNQYDKDYALFVNYEAAEVIALESKDEFTFIEVIGLSIMLKEVIPLQKFKEVIHSQASGKSICYCRRQDSRRYRADVCRYATGNNSATS